MASRLIRNQLPRNGLRVRAPCPPLLRVVPTQDSFCSRSQAPESCSDGAKLGLLCAGNSGGDLPLNRESQNNPKLENLSFRTTVR